MSDTEDLAAARAAIRAALALHREFYGDPEFQQPHVCCDICGWKNGWPCPTVAILREGLNAG